MPTDTENLPPDSSARRRPHEDALQLGPRKKPCVSDPLVHHGRHFGRTVHALCSVYALLTNGLLRDGERSDEPEDCFTAEERREYRVYRSLLSMVPGLEQRLVTASSDQEIRMIADCLQKGAASARSDDTKSLKSTILDWIVPHGEPLIPPIARNVKADRGFNHEKTGFLMCPAELDWSDREVKKKLRSAEIIVPGDQWPILLYQDYAYDPEDPWKGLLRSAILVSTFKHIFTSPSSVEKESKATRSGNARIHGMTQVTPAAIAYAATQARFALSSSATFTRSDQMTDSERFYNSILQLCEDPDEQEEVSKLLVWWNRQVFPSYSSAQRPVTKESALHKIREKRAALKARNTVG